MLTSVTKETQKKWIEQLNRVGIGKKTFKPTKNTRICIKHFTKNDFKSDIDKKGRKRRLASLKPNAVPSQYMNNDSPRPTKNVDRRVKNKNNHDHNYFNSRAKPPENLDAKYEAHKDIYFGTHGI